jgi:hypothetical protein
MQLNKQLQLIEAQLEQLKAAVDRHAADDIQIELHLRTEQIRKLLSEMLAIVDQKAS